MTKSDLIVRIAGEGGEGIISAGDMITQACARAGLDVYTFKTFPAEIKGGYAMYQLRASDRRLFNQGDTFDVLCAFNGEAYDLNHTRLKPGTALVYDSPGGDFEPDIPDGVHAYPIPMTATAKELKSPKAKNMVALGALSRLFDIPEDSLREVIGTKFGRKGEAVMQANLAAFARGRELAAALTKTDPFVVSHAAHQRDVVVMSGNHAIGLGALIAGLDFYSAYPITPATEIAQYVARHLPKRGGTLIQAEDEIASISQVIGASYAGKKAMTATSGPGLALMSEMLGMAFMSETPCVVVDVQRGGPSTGLPTKHEQSDLFLAIHGGHGDAGRIVLSVENVQDCIDLTVQAFNLAEKYQLPVLLLSDGSLAFSTQTIPYPDPDSYVRIARKRWDGEAEGEYKRYEYTEDGISPMADPGTHGGTHIATGLEHNELGMPNYTPANHEAMQDKRFRKLKTVAADLPPAEIDSDGAEGVAEIGIIAWGSTIGVVREAVQRLRDEGVRARGFYPKLLWPLPADQFEAFGAGCQRLLLPEVNFQGQLAHFVRAETTLRPESYTLCGGLPFTPDMIIHKVKEMLA